MEGSGTGLECRVRYKNGSKRKLVRSESQKKDGGSKSSVFKVLIFLLAMEV